MICAFSYSDLVQIIMEGGDLSAINQANDLALDFMAHNLIEKGRLLTSATLPVNLKQNTSLQHYSALGTSCSMFFSVLYSVSRDLCNSIP